MNTCPYCGSGVAAEDGIYFCGFCQMKGFQPSEDGTRQSRYQLKPYISHDDLKKTTPELMTYHTVDLLKVLKMLREERRSYFHLVSVFKKAGNETEEHRQSEKDTGNDYEEMTRKTWVVENILKDRIGYIPQRVTNQLLETVMQRSEQERNMKPMTIKKKEPELKREGIER